MKSAVRTRFAPSPTGHLHIGNARTAVMNWIFARHNGGRFILRIEDTDLERSTEVSEISILEDLRWLGLAWDEGPDVGGGFGPYRQSERIAIYREYILQLQEKEKIYPCYCSQEELEDRRKETMGSDKSRIAADPCRHISLAQRMQAEKEGRKPAYRFRIEDESVMFNDLIKGEITFQSENIGDFIVARPDGMPMYNFACIVDDHLMSISHVVRGDDHVSNTPRQILLYRALGWELPAFAHIPMILGKDRVRLSKRHGATSVDQYREMGYFPDALINFLSLLSWSSESGDEILLKERLIQEFDFSRVSKSSSVFDTEKLDWMNGMYIRKIDRNRFNEEYVFPVLKKRGFPVEKSSDTLPISDVLQDGVERISQLPDKARLFFPDRVVPEDAEAEALLHGDEGRRVCSAFLEETWNADIWSADIFQTVIKAVQKKTGIKGKNLWMPIRIALTGHLHGPELPRIAVFIGLDKCRSLIRQALGDGVG